jgi:hypothetical protein
MLDRAGGNPFLAVQVVSGLLSAQAQGADPGDLPGELVRAVGQLLQTLPSRAVDLVRLAAVYGERLPLDDAAELLDGVSARAVADAADEAVEAGLLSSERGAVLFRHDLVRESVYADLPERTRQSIHLSCARHLRDVGYDALTVAAHAREAIRPGDEAVALLLADAAGMAVTTLPQTAAELMLTSYSALRPGQPSWLAVGERCVEILSLVQRCRSGAARPDRAGGRRARQRRNRRGPRPQAQHRPGPRRLGRQLKLGCGRQPTPARRVHGLRAAQPAARAQL